MNAGGVKIVRDCSDPRLTEIIESSWYDFFKAWGSTPYGEVYEEDELKWVNLNVPQTHHGVFLAKLKRENMDEKIEEAIAYFRSKKLPFRWRIGTTKSPTPLGRALEAHGFTYSGTAPGMAVELDKMNEEHSPPKNLEIRQAQNEQALRDYLWVMCPTFSVGQFIWNWFNFEKSIGFGKDLPRRNYVGYLDGRPVSCAHMLITRGVVGIFCVATLPEVRGMGMGTALTLEPLKTARDMGFKVGVLQSSRMGLGIYNKIGFKQYCTIDQYSWKPV